MAEITDTRALAWDKAITQCQNLNQQLEKARPAEVDALELAIVAVQEELLELSAPSFLAVIQKLQILWELDLEKPDRDGAEKSQIVEDLTDLVDEAAATLGFGRMTAAFF